MYLWGKLQTQTKKERFSFTLVAKTNDQSNDLGQFPIRASNHTNHWDLKALTGGSDVRYKVVSIQFYSVKVKIVSRT